MGQTQTEIGSTENSVDGMDKYTVDETFRYEWLRSQLRANHVYSLIEDSVTDGELQEPVLTYVLAYMNYLVYRQHQLDVDDAEIAVFKARLNNAKQQLEVQYNVYVPATPPVGW